MPPPVPPYYALGAPSTTGDRSLLLIDRAHETALLQGSVGDATTGAAQVVVLEGNAGMGKSHLLRQVLGGGVSAVPVFTCACRLLQQEVPFWPLAMAWGRAGLSTRAGLIPDQPAFGAAVWAERLSGLLTRTAPLIVVDSAQWADPWTVRVLDALLAGTFGPPPALWLALRPGQVPGHVRGLLDNAEVTRLRLDTLARQEIALAVAAHVDDAAAAGAMASWLFLASAGLPYLLRATVEALHQEGILTFQGVHWQVDRQRLFNDYAGGLLPQGAADVLGRTVCRLTQDEIELLRICAVAGDMLSHTTLRALAGQPVGATLDRLVATHLMRREEDEWGARYRLTLPSLPAVILNGMGDAQREDYVGRIPRQ